MHRIRNLAVAFGTYLAAIVGANYMIAHIGTAVPGAHLLPVGFGLSAPSGVYLAGFAFVARDVIQRLGGHKPALAAIVLGAAVSWFVASPVIAVASGLTFLCSETADYLTYTPLQKSNFPLAVFLSGIVGDVIDSTMFLILAGIALGPALPGLLLGKLWVLIGGGLVAYALRKRPTFAVAA